MKTFECVSASTERSVCHTVDEVSKVDKRKSTLIEDVVIVIAAMCSTYIIKKKNKKIIYASSFIRHHKNNNNNKNFINLESLIKCGKK